MCGNKLNNAVESSPVLGWRVYSGWSPGDTNSESGSKPLRTVINAGSVRCTGSE